MKRNRALDINLERGLGDSVKRDLDWFLRVKIWTVEVGSTVVFVALVGWIVLFELRHLFWR